MAEYLVGDEIPYKTKFNIDTDQFLEDSVFDWKLSVRTVNCFRSEGISKKSELLKMSRSDLMNIKNFGLKSLEEIERHIELIGKDEKVYFDESQSYSRRFNIDIEEFTEASVWDWDLSVRTKNCLIRAGISRQSEVLKFSKTKLSNIKNLGSKSLKEIEKHIKLLAEEQKAYIIPSKFKKYVNDLIDGDIGELTKLATSSNEKIFLDRFAQEAPLIDDFLRKEAYLCSDEIISIDYMLRKFIYENKRDGKLKNEINQLLRKTNDERLKMNIEPFLFSFKNKKLKKLILSNYPNMKVGDTNRYIELIRSGMNKKDVIDFLKYVTFNINYDFNLMLSSTLDKRRDLFIIEKRARGLTLEAIGEDFGVTRERIRQIEAKNIKKLISWFKKYRFIEKVFALNKNLQVITMNEIVKEIEEEKQLLEYIIPKYLENMPNYEYVESINSVIIKKVFDYDKLNEFLTLLPECFDDKELDELLYKNIDDVFFLESMKKYIQNSYTKSGEVYHQKKLSFTEIYKRVLYKYYPNGLKIYDSEAMENFRKNVILEFGDLDLPENNRAIAARIGNSAILCDRGTYKIKNSADLNIDTKLIEDIRSYILKSKREIILIRSVFNVFKSRLKINQIDNRYCLHGVLREIFDDEFFFNKDCILKNKSEKSIGDEISNFICEFNYPITQEQIRKEFPGATYIVIARAISFSGIVNLFGKYIHIDKLGVDEYKKKVIDKAIEEILADKDIHHAKDLYYKINQEQPNFWKQICVEYPFSAFSVAEIILNGKYQFERPFFSNERIEVKSKEELLRFEFENENQLSVKQVHDLAKHYRLSFTSIYSLLEIIMESHYLIDKNSLIKEDNISFSQEEIYEIEEMIISSLEDEHILLIRFLSCVPMLPKIGYKWNEWLILSFIKKHSTRLEVDLSSNFYAKAYPIVALKGCMNRDKYKEIILDEKETLVNDMSDIEELLDDIEIEF